MKNSASINFPRSFCDRYPDLALKIQIFSEEKGTEYLFEEPESFFTEIFSSKTDVVYIIGLCISPFFDKLSLAWLENFPSRKIIFLEKEIVRIHHFLSQEKIENILENPQITIVHFDNSLIPELALFSPTASIHIAISQATRSQEPALWIQGVQEALYKESFQASYALREIVFSSKILENYLGNGKNATASFSMEALRGKGKGVPAIICGAGPSLDAAIPALKKVQDQAFIFAAGSAITALSVANVEPHFLVAIDPNTHEFLRLQEMQAFEVPLIHFFRLCKQVAGLHNGPRGIVPTQGLSWMTLFEACIQEKTQEIVHQMDPESSSVTTFATALAVHLGCSPIIFCGVDLANSQESTYSQYVSLRHDESSLDSEEIIVRKKGVLGTVSTPIKWWTEAKALGRYIKRFPSHTFYNASLGIEIKNSSPLSLEKIFTEGKFPSIDILGFTHALTSLEKVKFDEKAFVGQVADLQKSAERVVGILEKIVKMLEMPIPFEQKEIEILLLELDLAEEPFYTLFLEPGKMALELLQRGAPSSPFELYTALRQQAQSFEELFRQF